MDSEKEAPETNEKYNQRDAELESENAGHQEKEDEARNEEEDQLSDQELKPDVILDVPFLDVDELNLEVDELEANVALKAGVGNLLTLEVGADITISNVKLEIEGVETQAHLRVRLKRVQNILQRTLDSLDSNPDLLQSVLEPAEDATEEATEEVEEGGQALD